MAGLMSVKVTGLPAFEARLQKLAGRLPAAMGESLYRDMVGVMLESQKIVPFEEGDLHDSGEVDRPEIDGGKASVSLHYGSATVNYALIQHENLTYHHPNGGSAKFLETPLHQWADAGPAAVVRRALRGLR